MKAQPVTCAGCAALAARISTFEARLATLELGVGPRDNADVALVHALAYVFGMLPYRAGHVMSTDDRELRAALLAADITNERQLGQLLTRLCGRNIEGLCIRRAARRRYWQVVIVAV